MRTEGLHFCFGHFCFEFGFFLPLHGIPFSFVEQKRNWILKKLEESKNKPEEREYTKTDIENLKNKLEYIFPELIKQTNLVPNKIRIRNIKYAWGSCSSNKNITINLKLVDKSEEEIKYVVLHELCHLKYMNHSDKFWNLVEKYMPNYKEIRKQLKHFPKIVLELN